MLAHVVRRLSEPHLRQLVRAAVEDINHIRAEALSSYVPPANLAEYLTTTLQVGQRILAADVRDVR
jgi:hypothetical protein